MKLNKLAMGVAAVGVVLIGGYLMMKQKGPGSMQEQGLQQALKSTLPAEAQGKLLVNQDRVNVGKQYISVIHQVEDDSKVKETVSKFIYQAFSRLDSKDMATISAVNIVLYQMTGEGKPTTTVVKDAKGKEKTVEVPAKPQTKQYRVLIGSNVAKKQPASFWKAGDQTELFKWLTATCPTTDSRNLTDFCDISSSLKE